MKRLSNIAILAALALLFASCSKEETAPVEETEPVEEQPETAAETPAADTETVQVVEESEPEGCGVGFAEFQDRVPYSAAEFAPLDHFDRGGDRAGLGCSVFMQGASRACPLGVPRAMASVVRCHSAAAARSSG